MNSFCEQNDENSTGCDVTYYRDDNGLLRFMAETKPCNKDWNGLTLLNNLLLRLKTLLQLRVNKV